MGSAQSRSSEPNLASKWSGRKRAGAPPAGRWTRYEEFARAFKADPFQGPTPKVIERIKECEPWELEPAEESKLPLLVLAKDNEEWFECLIQKCNPSVTWKGEDGQKRGLGELLLGNGTGNYGVWSARQDEWNRKHRGTIVSSPPAARSSWGQKEFWDRFGHVAIAFGITGVAVGTALGFSAAALGPVFWMVISKWHKSVSSGIGSARLGAQELQELQTHFDGCVQIMGRVIVLLGEQIEAIRANPEDAGATQQRGELQTRVESLQSFLEDDIAEMAGIARSRKSQEEKKRFMMGKLRSLLDLCTMQELLYTNRQQILQKMSSQQQLQPPPDSSLHAQPGSQLPDATIGTAGTAPLSGSASASAHGALFFHPAAPATAGTRSRSDYFTDDRPTAPATAYTRSRSAYFMDDHSSSNRQILENVPSPQLPTAGTKLHAQSRSKSPENSGVFKRLAPLPSSQPTCPLTARETGWTAPVEPVSAIHANPADSQAAEQRAELQTRAANCFLEDDIAENFQSPADNFPKRSGVAEPSTPTICAEEALSRARHQENSQPPAKSFAKGSGVAEPSTPMICAEEADSIPDDAPLQEITLAKCLGPNPVVYLSMSHAVELEVQAGSLREEVNRPVTVSPRIQFVECRTEGSGRAPSHEDGRKEEFLAMTFVHGPEQASFLKDKPAKLRFFVGYVDDFSAEDYSDELVVDEKDIEQHVLETFRPLTSPNGVDGWRVMNPFSVLFPPPVLGDREVWVEVALHHFCTIAMAMKTVASAMKVEGAAQQSYFYEDIGRSRWRLRLRPRGRPPMPRAYFGNATEKHAVFTYYPIVTYSETTKERDINAHAEAAAVKLGGGTRSLFSAVGGDLPAAGEGIPAILAPGDYTAYELTCGIKEHSQMHVRVGVLVDMTGEGPEATGKLQLLDVRKISGNTILVLRPPRLSRPSLFGKIDWPCNKEIICTTQGANSNGRP